MADGKVATVTRAEFLKDSAAYLRGPRPMRVVDESGRTCMYFGSLEDGDDLVEEMSYRRGARDTIELILQLGVDTDDLELAKAVVKVANALRARLATSGARSKE